METNELESFDIDWSDKIYRAARIIEWGLFFVAIAIALINIFNLFNAESVIPEYTVEAVNSYDEQAPKNDLAMSTLEKWVYSFFLLVSSQS